MESTLLSTLPNLSIGVISVLSLVYTTIRFLTAMDDRTKRHEIAMKEREDALRETERRISDKLIPVLVQTTNALEENTRLFTRVAEKIDRI